MKLSNRTCKVWLSLVGLAVLAACSTAHRPAPVEDRSAQGKAPTAPMSAAPAQPEASKPLPGAENAGKPGYYTVQRGDNLTRIGLDHGQGWRDLARWNNIANPDVIEVGQVVRVTPPGSAVESTGVVVRPVAQNGQSTPQQTNAQPGTSVKPAPVVTPAPVSEDIAFAWPASGSVIAGFDEAKNKGLDIGGKAGDAVLAAADGQVVYAGAGLRGYGNLVILKHNSTYLTAYAHNQKLLVKEDQKVRKGDKIAEMGNSDADRVKLHFEVRRQGKPVDPAKFLAAR
ncbi:peptidoglycan DD-metalloendopeptidase family protein [Limnohabitans radicicola]|uniref:Peptidoglycan DD-metalloendopeptidase family protein n=1 Tax=Limnohabitans radicicola TaxID=2771427 RepID=A0A927FHS6_9BURK|nr:peptidoglycan DD-metalloendopeptidase family protein [Limnohabitans radicicola]MBD8051226.1 peptidoglycan DD-metalloendopeptidase family protein [Limnohabitans radicicola]